MMVTEDSVHDMTNNAVVMMSMMMVMTMMSRLHYHSGGLHNHRSRLVISRSSMLRGRWIIRRLGRVDHYLRLMVSMVSMMSVVSVMAKEMVRHVSDS
jgi:hypothetical protein